MLQAQQCVEVYDVMIAVRDGRFRPVCTPAIRPKARSGAETDLQQLLYYGLHPTSYGLHPVFYL